MSGFSGDFVTLINRTSKVLRVRYDGREFPIQPGENPGFPREMIKFAREQNPLMGGENWMKPSKFPALVGVKGVDDCSPLEQNEKAVERFDSTTIPGRQTKKKGPKGKPRTRARVIQGTGDADPVESRVASIEEGDVDGFIDGATYESTR